MCVNNVSRLLRTCVLLFYPTIASQKEIKKDPKSEYHISPSNERASQQRNNEI